MYSESEKDGIFGKFTHNLGTVGLSYLLTLVRGLITIALLTKNLPADDYGLWVLYYRLINIIPLLLTLGLPFGLTRFVAGQVDLAKSRKEFHTVLFFVAGISIVAFPVLFILISQITGTTKEQITINLIFCLIIAIECINLVFLNYIRAKRRFGGFLVIASIQNLSMIGLIWMFATQKKISVANALLSVLISDSLVFFSCATLFFIFIRIARPKTGLIKKYIKFGLPLAPANLSSWVVTSGDRYIIAGILGLTSVGYYAPAYSLASMMFNVLVSPLAIILPPTLSSYYDKGQFKELESYVKRSLQYYHFLAIPGIFGLFVVSRDLLEILTTEEIAENSSHLVPIIALGLYFWGLFIILGHSMILTEATDVNAYVWAFCASLNIVLNLVLVPIVGIEGAAITMVITYGVSVCCVIFYISRAKMHYFYQFSVGFLVRILAASFLMMPVTYLAISLIPKQYSLASETNVMLFIFGCAIVYFCLAFLFLKMNLRRFFPTKA